jgi:hypothetical protein
VGPKVVVPNKFVPERFHYCIEHDTKMSAVATFGSKAIHYECKDGCKLSKGAAILK